jgi:hydrogenase/urease accessory protein HupE
LLAGVLAASLLGEALGHGAVALPFAAGVITHVVLTQLVPVAMRHRLGLPLLLGVAIAVGMFERLIPHTH